MDKPQMTATQVKFMQDTHLKAQGAAVANKLNKDLMVLWQELNRPKVLLRVALAKRFSEFTAKNQVFSTRNGGTMGPHFMNNWRDRLERENFATLSLTIERRA